MKRKLTINQLKSIIKEEAQKLNRRSLLENEKRELQNELFGIFGGIDNSVKDSINRLKDIKITRELDYDDGPNALNNMNDILNSILQDEKINKKLKESNINLYRVKSNIGVDKYGRNRAEDGSPSNAHNLFLGDTHGLNTLPLYDWINLDDSEQNADTKNIIANQLFEWIDSNRNAAIKMLEQLIEK